MEKELQELECRLAEALTGSMVPMDTVMRYVGSVAGKRLRPRLVFLSARLFGEVNERVRRTALFVELLHTATLIHDDVVDGSDTRREQPSVNARWGNKTAVLAGDYLLSKAMLQLAEPADSPILKEMLETAMEMSEGELSQLRVERLELRVESYLDIITRKTGALMRACCVGGALAGNADCEDSVIIRLIGEFGINYGLVFQMRDDIMDDDDPGVTAMARALLPEYVDKANKALEALAPFVKDADALEGLRSFIR